MEGHSRDDLDESPAVPSKDTETAEQAVPVPSPAQVDDDVEPGGGLGVQCVSPRPPGRASASSRAGTSCSAFACTVPQPPS